MKRIILVLVPLLLSSLNVQAVELGGGYNEQLASIYNALIVKSGVKWVRAYVNIPRNYLTYGIVPNSPDFPLFPITGVVDGNISQEPDHVSSDADVLAVAAVDKLIDTKSVTVGGRPIKIILSLKHDFTYPYPDTPPFGRVPDPSTVSGHQEVEYLISAIENLLTKNNRGKYIDILVVGNEPMYEVQLNTDPVTADNYGKYLNLLIGRLDILRQNNKKLGWNYEIFVGALNHASMPTTNQILPKILDIAKHNPLVEGIDLHEHVMSPSDAELDILLVRDVLGPNMKIISTEFSLIELWSERQTKPLGFWGKQHGYTEKTLFWEWINDLMRKAAAGQPVSQDYFMSYFNAQPWYPKHWFKKMLNIFEKHGLYAVTYGLEEAPRVPLEANYLNGKALPWVLNAVYNGTIFGTAKNGYYNTNPLVFPDFEDAIDNMNSHGSHR